MKKMAQMLFGESFGKFGDFRSYPQGTAGPSNAKAAGPSGVKISEVEEEEEEHVEAAEKVQAENYNPVKTPLNTNQKFRLEDEENKIDGHTYRNLIGSLLYLTNIRPDIMQVASLLSRFMQNPSKIHYGATRRVLRYLKGTSSYGLWYSNANNLELCGFSDSDWAGSLDDRKSTYGYVFHLGSGAICWNSKKQPSTALSSSEDEYIVVASVACKEIWLQQIVNDMKQKQEGGTIIFCDN
ncbi:hypothetical protein GH714_016674 [Hevea brasiliensis]|uniref:Reverse transcriptase Ty1/copia-type domain-containing protein n=1 Tax=Hevea brasiliensis TaxID=3981 RepID=A0A6A6NHV8_HEVBR|nr:hypothetical protein GH714_016674 [Hevea brasiliensis]